MNSENTNVINLEDAKKLKELKQKENEFKAYLRSLKQDQLQYEANYLMNKAGDDLNEETLKKSALLMEELAKRVNGSDKMSTTIGEYAKRLRERSSQANKEDDLLQ